MKWRGETGDPRENPPTSNTILTRVNPGATRLVIEPGSPRWEAIGLTTKPRRPHRAGILYINVLHPSHRARWRSSNSLDSHSGGSGFESQYCHSDFGLTWLPKIAPGECWDRHGTTVAERLAHSPPTKAIWVQSPAGSLRIFACGNRGGPCLWSVGFLGYLPFTSPFHSGAVPHPLPSPSSALKTSMLRAFTPLISLGALMGDKDYLISNRGRGGLAARLLASPHCPQTRQTGFDSRWTAPRFPHLRIASNDAAGGRVFSGISRLPRSCIPGLLHTHLASPPIDSQDLDVKSRPNLFTHSLHLFLMQQVATHEHKQERSRGHYCQHQLPPITKPIRASLSWEQSLVPFARREYKGTAPVTGQSEQASEKLELNENGIYCSYTKDEVDRSLWLRTTNLRVPISNCIFCKTSPDSYLPAYHEGEQNWRTMQGLQ
ncbi:hypothetical protein PR048_026945 [Dryococelus australis]|uniref:Uncharacterized protein n=1 Tax=Dryococelus australis TaxID=614101 RepID=A0ABQ9GMR1_9NEOP|nr:hypothetical protein PR048_026945 [Dryococelus australis]